MRRAYIDFETYYSREYSLLKITPAEYVCDPRFELFGAACAYDDEPPVWLEDYELQSWVETLAAEPTILFAHNMLFDATIASWHLHATPLLWGCTMSMARGILNSKVRKFSLASLAEYFSLGAKGSAVHNMIGVTRSMMKSNPAQYEAYKAYCCNDLELCRKLERILAPSFPASEYLVIDTLIRAVTEPMFQLDMVLVYQYIAEVQARKWELLQAVQMDTPVDLMSNAKFAACLEGLGIEPPTKISKTTGLETYAFARTDKAMDELAEHEDPRVQALVAARLRHKSTLEESRSHRFISVAQACGNMMPVPLRYSGAHTHRFSGDWKMNMQNLGRESKLRRALVAPPGYKVVAADASQIECRLGAWLADWTWLLDQFRDPTQDPYANYASQLFEKHVVPKAKTPERFVGKQSLLSLQFGASWVSFQRMCRVMGNLELTQEQAEVYVSKYRKLAAPIKQFWALCERLIRMMANGDFMQHKCIFTRFEEIRLPSGLALNYPGLWFDKVAQPKGPDRRFSTWRYGDTGIGLFGGKLMENLCQSLARVIVTDAGTRIRRKHKIHYKMQVHDELIYIVPDEQAEWLRELLVQELSITPVWAPGLPLAAEGKIGINYGEMG